MVPFAGKGVASLGILFPPNILKDRVLLGLAAWPGQLKDSLLELQEQDTLAVYTQLPLRTAALFFSEPTSSHETTHKLKGIFGFLS